MAEKPSRAYAKPILAIFIALMAAAVGVIAAVPDRSAPTEAAAVSSAAPFAAQIALQRQQLDRLPGNATGWAELGAAYVELARVTGDPRNYGEARRALDRSMELRPNENADALFGLGVLANALHDFAAARSYGERVLALRPDSAEAYGVLADALTQLGAADAATAAVQRMLDLRPGVPSFTRAAYDLELRGRTDEARQAMQRALAAATTADQIAFCRYHLGELAFHAGNLDEAENHYRSGLSAVPDDAALRQGGAKVLAARGATEQAITQYRELTGRAPLPEYLIEFGELLESAGRRDEADDTYREIADRFRELEAQGATDYVAAALFAADHGDPAEAVRLARTEFGRRQSVVTADVLAWSLHRAGRHEEALGYAERAAALGWRNATVTYHRGMILAALGRTAQAAAALDEALRTNPHFSPLHAPRARRALETLGAAP
ncbi:tetratricopeptide repeat protein [Nocardia mexicana]|uniref:Tetratricopeptide repeat protein n=1 Tax=Nocardia mexicana TaxID=279262 RepID=A0A370H837_9NOCA|nr:tetratricopeptide repeat protein [Nocardia mexicana]RDI52835.1 tetratricopeptide repeat protein [Nocardia mexicana]